MKTTVKPEDIGCASAAADLFEVAQTCTGTQLARVAQLFADHRQAAADRELRAPVPELADSFPVVLYLRNAQDRDELIAALKEAKPDMISRNL